MGFIKSLLGIKEDESDLVRKAGNLKDPRARKLVVDEFIRITDIPALYAKLEAAGGEIALDHEELASRSTPPEEVKQLMAGAVMNYELCARDRFRIIADERSATLLGVPVKDQMVAIIQRRMSVADHERVAGIYEDTAGVIYDAYDEAQGRLMS